MNCFESCSRRDWGRGSKLTVLQRVGARHYVDRINKELSRDPRFLLFLPKPNSPNPGITTTDGFESRSLENPELPVIVVAFVILAVGRDLFLNSFL